MLDKSEGADESISLLTGVLNGRLEEGHGEALFDLGLEDNGDPMGFTREDWEFALARLKQTTSAIGADYKLLMTKNVGGDVEVESLNPKEKAVSGKLMIRRRPQSVDDCIETRIAVVGNGRKHAAAFLTGVTLTSYYSRCWQEYNAGSASQGWA